MKNFLCLALAGSLAFSALADTLTSPAGRVTVTTSPNYTNSLSLCYDGFNVVDIPLIGIAIDSEPKSPATIKSVSAPMHVIDSYQMLTGKKSQCSNEAYEYTLTCGDVAGRPMSMIVRVYNDGVAYRYVVEGLESNHITDELTTYFIPEGTKRWFQAWCQPYEDFYPLSTTGESKSHKWGYPALLEPHDGVFALISEADIKPWHAASYLTNVMRPDNFKVSFDPNETELSGTWQSPWRVVYIGDLPTIVNSTLVTDVSTPSTIADTSWIKPGSVSWVYWAYNHGSNDFQIVKKYIDMAAALNLPYVLIDAEWDEMTNGGTIEDAVAYANSIGVKPLIWYNSSTAWTKEWGAPSPHNRLNDPADREAEFAKIADMGVAGVKIDFFDGDKQETMAYCIELLESAAKHNLLVNFHGATIPRGWQRTYPNLMSVEGVYGEEWYNNKPVLTSKAAAHNATLPFTRNVIGPMDYTPCAFSDSQHPHITSNAHELALPVLYESALTHWADKPESYYAQPKEVQEFIGIMPTVWDDTRLLGGYPADYVVMARRSGDTWYIAAINGHDEEITVDVDWSMLNPEATYRVQTFADSKDAPWLITEKIATKADMPKSITMLPRGGQVKVISPPAP